jgi:hypothetical protein
MLKDTWPKIFENSEIVAKEAPSDMNLFSQSDEVCNCPQSVLFKLTWLGGVPPPKKNYY